MVPVENVNMPKRVTEVDPRSQGGKKTDDVQYWESRKAMNRARREAMTEEKEIERIENPPEQAPPAFQVRGGINLGEIDLQEEQRQAKQEALLARQASDERIKQLEKERDDAREALHTASINNMRETLTTQIEQLKKAIEGGSSKGDIGSQLESIATVAEKYLGLSRTAATGATTNNWDAQLALKRLEAELKREDRKILIEMKREDRQWQLDLKKLEQAQAEANEKLRIERENRARMNDILASIPEKIGEGLAAGIQNRGSGEQPAARFARTRRPAAQAAPAAEVSAADPPEEKVLKCEDCGTDISYTPADKTILCPECGSKYER